jgi:1-deoxy-D-xylulose-5-phosphate reductoisomerase
VTRRSVTVLGATGSIGKSTLDLVGANSDRFEVLALTANSDAAGLAAAARAVGARRAVLADETSLPALREALAGTRIEAAAGPAAMIEAAAAGADWTMAAIVGCAGLEPLMAAVAGGGTIALANKEALVSAGAVVTRAVEAAGARLLPVDSEHNAIFQCFDAERPHGVARVILTASGGPFREASLEQLEAATPAQAVAHPNWSMGAKISVDSATLMNKGLELIEAAYLFPVEPERIEIVVHPQSVIHSMVEYKDGSVLAQLGPSDMRTPIAHTLAWPDRMDALVQRLDFATLGSLTFEAPDPVRFPALRLAREALRSGGCKPAILNAANEVAVAAFLAGEIGFRAIAALVETVLARFDPPPPASLADVLAIDAEARVRARDAKKAFLR